MPGKNWIQRLIASSILIGALLCSPGIIAFAQEIATETPTETQTEIPTETPAETPVPPQPTETLPAIDTPTEIPPLADTPTADPGNTATPEIIPSETPTETPSETPSEAPTLDLTLTITPTETATLTPTPTEEVAEESWQVEYDLFYPSAMVDGLGGQEAVEAELQGYLSALESEKEVSYNLTAEGQGGGILFLLTIEGTGGLAQFKYVYLDILAPSFGTTSGITQVWINSSGRTVTDWQLTLDSNITTGYSWRTVEADGITEISNGYQDGSSNEIGATGYQYFSFTNNESETNSVSLKYSSPWEADAPPTRRVILNIPLEEDINLGSPAIMAFSAMSEPAMPESAPLEAAPDMSLLGAVPANFDWRDSGKVPPIRNQGSCGSCYAFATVGVMESAMLISGISTDLSEQFLVSCTNQGERGFNNGCSGGRPDSHVYHFDTLANLQSAIGAVFESDMPYTASESACFSVGHPYRLLSWHKVNPTWNTIPDTETIKNAIYNYGPIAASVCSKSAFDAYRGGIFTTNETCNGSPTNHAIILTGWETDSNNDTIWVLRNSWGTWWGDSGYMYIKAGTSSVGYNATYVVYELIEDRIAPMVTKLDSSSHTPDNKIINNEEVSVGVTQLMVTFDENMYSANGVNDVATLSNYSLINLGADDLSGGGDDIPVVINSAAYNSTTRTIALNINNNTSLPNAIYKFSVSGSGSVKDTAGNQLDGNGDGLAGGDYLMSFRISVKPAATVLLFPISGSITNDNTPELSWAGTNLAASYEVLIARDSAFSSQIYKTNIGSALSITLPAMADGKYYWKVRGINRFGYEGTWSAPRYFSVDVVAPKTPTLVSPADLGSYRGTPLFSWNASSSAKYYQFKTTTTLGAEIYTSGEVATSSHQPINQPLGVLLWQVRARDAAGNWSGWSTPRSLLIKPKIPAAPALISPLNNAYMMNRTPTLDWSEVPYGTMYEFQIAPADTFKTILQGGATPSTEFTLISLADGRYYWRVRAINVDGEKGIWSNIRYFTVDNVPPDAPNLYKPGNNRINKGTPTYYWYSTSTGYYYQFRYTTTEGSILYTSPEIKGTSHKPPTQPIGHYLWQVRARDRAGNWSEWSSTRSIEIQAPIPAPPKLTAPANQSKTTDTTPLFGWNPADYATDYEISISKNSGFTAIIQQRVITGGTEFTADALVFTGTGTNYYWRVRSINAYGQYGSWSAYRYFKLIP